MHILIMWPLTHVEDLEPTCHKNFTLSVGNPSTLAIIAKDIAIVPPCGEDYN
jgi:hypothetical protein